MSDERPNVMMEKQNSVTMEYFLETSHLDSDTAALLKKYDKDGNGSFSKDEVAAIIMDLREAMRSNQELGSSNKLFKRLLIASCIFCILLLASMFGLSYAVAALTAKTDVDSTGALTKAGSSEHVSTDSRAEIHVVTRNQDGQVCITNDELVVMYDEVSVGKNVMFESTNRNGTTVVSLVSGVGAELSESGTMCFNLPDGKKKCFVPSDCEDAVGRMLTEDEHRRLGTEKYMETMRDGHEKFWQDIRKLGSKDSDLGSGSTQCDFDGDCECYAEGSPCLAAYSCTFDPAEYDDAC